MTDKNANTEIRKEFCPNCEADVPCTHEAELYVCDICGEDFAKYIVSRNCTLPDVSTTRDVLTPIKTSQSNENTNPDYYKHDAVSAGKVSVDVKRELTDAEITRLENRFADTEACDGRLVEQVEQLTAENKRLKAVLNEWDMAWLTDCIAPQPNGNEAFGLDEGLVLCARMMKPILEETRFLLRKAEVVR